MPEKNDHRFFLNLGKKNAGKENCIDYYPFGLTFNSYQRENSSKNRYLYNQGAGKETFNTERIFDLDLNVDQSRYRTYDYSTGRWWQVDPKAEAGGQESLTTYQYSFNNPVLYNDPNGDCPPGVDCKAFAKGLWNSVTGAVDFAKETWNSKGQNLVQAAKNTYALAELAHSAPGVAKDLVVDNAKQGIANKIKENGTVQGAASEIAGGIAGGVVTGILGDKGLSKLSGLGKAGKIANVVPDEVARVISADAGDVKTLGRPGESDVFVTAASDIKGLDAKGIASKLTIPESPNGFQVFQFKTPEGIASPINRNTPGFVGGGKTAGGAREFVVPNQAVPADATKKIIR